MSSGSIPANIESIVNDLKSITWEQVIFEAVTNSLQANATEIDIKFIQKSLDLEDTKKYIEQIIIEDNGDGFTEKNINSFQIYGITHKKHLGAKGIGRFLYLKIFNKINIKSLDKEINFVIDKNIEVDNLNQKKFNKTTIYFDKPKIYFVVDFKELEQKIRDHFIAYFKLYKKQVSIKLFENYIKKIEIKSNEIPEFKTKEFKIHSHIFTLDYVFNSKNIKYTDGYYCADNRVVVKNSHLESTKKLKAFNNINIVYLLSSEYFNNNVNRVRDNFDIMPIRTKDGSLFQDISWKDIQDELTKQIKIIAKENDIDIDEIAKKNLKESIEEAPYLINYLKDNENILSPDLLIKNAMKILEDDKKYLRDINNKLKEDYQIKLGRVTQSELAEYIFDRQKIIDKLKELTDDKVLEKEIHNLFMKKYTEDEEQNYKSNNLWLFDDRFMAYDKIFSDKQIKDIFPKLSENLDKPDILSIVSNTYEKEEITDIVIIELKRPDGNIDPAGAEAQLLRYSRYINDLHKDNKIRIWTYAFLKFNENTELDLDDKSYNKIPVQGKYPIYYKYYEKPNTIINFLDYHSLALDANTRNKTFMKILKGDTIKNENT